MNACEICGTDEGVLCNWNNTGWRCSQHATDVPTSNQTMLWPLDDEAEAAVFDDPANQEAAGESHKPGDPV